MALSWYERIKHAVRFWLLRRLPNCQHTVKVISQSFERSLTVRERVLLKVHFWVCMWCLWYLEHLQTMRSTLQIQSDKATEMDFPTSTSLSAEARERMKRRLSGK